MNKKPRNGFLLINLIITIGVIALIATATFPALYTYQPALRLKGESRALIAQLREAQQRTITEQISHYVFIDTAHNRYQLFRDENPDVLLSTTVLDGGISISDVSDITADSVVFNSYGAVSDGGNIVLINGLANTRTIVIRPSGYVRLE